MSYNLPDHPGLTSAAAESALQQWGPNSLPEPRPDRWWQRVLRQLRSSLIYILLFALAFDLAIWAGEGAHEWPFESIAIAVILGFNTAMGVWQEHRSEDALSKLRALASPHVWVARDGVLTRVDVVEIVPGDIARIESGDRVPADGVMVATDGIMVDESLLTGESMPEDRLEGGEVFAGTLVVRGAGFMEVTRTGALSAMGRIATMLGGVTADQTPLERRLNHFGHRIARYISALAVLLAVFGVIIDGPAHAGDALLFAVAVAVAAVPEGMPAVMTLTLALGTERMSRRKAVIRRLSAVEALGSVTVIATDKTGTLTENTMTVHEVHTPDVHRDMPRALRAMVLACDAEPGTSAGDPLEHSLYAYAALQGIDPATTRAQARRLGVRPFDAQWRYMRVTVDEAGEPVSYLKGAAEVLLHRSTLSEHERHEWHAQVEHHSQRGYRTLGLAWAPGEREHDVTWIGLVLLWDPPRPEVPAAVAAARAAGIRVLMITGDHPSTAASIAAEVGIDADAVLTGPEMTAMSPDELREAVATVDVFARVSPEAKLALVEALRDAGEVVAMTGDGVNDAPALKRADVGVAMGQRGSDVSREVADMVLLDDNFATIVAAVEEGRGIYENIQKFIRFLFSTNVALVLLIGAGVLGSAILGLQDDAGNILVPLTAAQLLWINVLADGPPALALALDRNRDVMCRAPRAPNEPLLDRISLRFVLITGLVKGALGLALLVSLPSAGFSDMEVRSAVFVYEALAQLAYVYPARRVSGSTHPNRVLNIIVAVSVVLQLSTAFVPMLRTTLQVAPVSAQLWMWIAVAVATSWGFAEAYTRRTRGRGAAAGTSP